MRDHFGVDLGIISGSGIISGAVQIISGSGSFRGLYRMKLRDELRDVEQFCCHNSNLISDWWRLVANFRTANRKAKQNKA